MLYNAQYGYIHMLRWTTHHYSFVQDHVEGDAECHNKQEGDHHKLEKGVEDGVEHENVDAQQWHSLQEEDEVDPGEEDAKCSQLPLPVSGTPAVAPELDHKQNGEDVGEPLNVVLHIQQVMMQSLQELEDLHSQTCSRAEEDHDGSNVQDNVGRKRHGNRDVNCSNAK